MIKNKDVLMKGLILLWDFFIYVVNVFVITFHKGVFVHIVLRLRIINGYLWDSTMQNGSCLSVNKLSSHSPVQQTTTNFTTIRSLYVIQLTLWLSETSNKYLLNWNKDIGL